MARYVSIPTVTIGLTPWQKMFMDAVKEDVELLTDQRGDGKKAAIVRGDVTTDYLAQAAGPTLAEVNAITDKVNALIAALRRAA
jgi:hypothetical protein